jgi:pyruvate/2-oxoglutarate dehydrogenase complex dihydrolipoamide acyltransferase (E2) component
MAIDVKLPELGDGIESGDVLDVLVTEGEVIRKDQPLCEIETDKATVPIPSSHAGKVLKVHVSTGDSVPVGGILVTLDASEESPVSPPTAPTQPAVAAPGPAPETARKEPTGSTTEEETPAAKSPPAPARPVPQPAPARAATPPSTPPVEAEAAERVAPAGPAIRRLAREVGVDLLQVQGTGPGGRITRDDVLAVVRQSAKLAAAPRTTASTQPPASDASPAKAPDAAEEDGTADPWGPIRTERTTKIRKTIASKMHASWSTIPRVTNFDDADVTALERIRQASKADYSSRGLKLTTMPFVIKSVAMALRNNPTLNASFDEENGQIIYKHYVNIGIAVDTERGLVVPSLRRADDLGIPEITRALANIADNARNNNFKIEDLRGSTFSISNLGAIGGTYSTPIINPPEVAILLIGRSRKMPVVVEDEIKVRLMMPLSLSYDHRLVDGAAAARFLNDVIGYLEAPSRLLIAP